MSIKRERTLVRPPPKLSSLESKFITQLDVITEDSELPNNFSTLHYLTLPLPRSNPTHRVSIWLAVSGGMASVEEYSL